MDRYLYICATFLAGCFASTAQSAVPKMTNKQISTNANPPAINKVNSKLKAGRSDKQPFHHVFDQSKKKFFISRGRFTGGESGKPINLVSVEFNNSPSGERERLQLKFADEKGRVLREKLGYTHVAVESRPPRVVIDLDQVLRTSVDGQALRKILNKSKLIANSEMTMDPQDHSTNITLQMKESRSVSVFTQKDKSGEIILAIELRKKPSTKKSRK